MTAGPITKLGDWVTFLVTASFLGQVALFVALGYAIGDVGRSVDRVEKKLEEYHECRR